MGKKHKPRSGSLAFYPKVRADKETPSFHSFPRIESTSVKPLNFLGYKVGMIHAFGRSEGEKTTSFGQTIMLPCTVIECPPLTVFGVRAYKKTVNGLKTVGEVLAEKVEKHLFRKLHSFKKKSQKKKKSKTVEEEVKKIPDLNALEKMLDSVSELRLLVHTNPYLTGIGKKKPAITELGLNGLIQDQFAFAKQKLGQQIKVKDVFNEKQFVDVKAVDKGKGFSGVVKKFGVKIQRPKAKYHRKIGSIGPWHPATVMWTVGRPGQLGYQNRTEFNKRILKIDSNPDSVNVLGGFTNYGLIKNDFMLLSGSIPGAIKRCVGLREPMRIVNEKKSKVSDVFFVHALNKVAGKVSQ